METRLPCAFLTVKDQRMIAQRPWKVYNKRKLWEVESMGVEYEWKFKAEAQVQEALYTKIEGAWQET